ncbi:MAG: OmpH family outer membrane protein [Deltaproteobacteria bacterium]|nr:MAG: OmpH family outer membrane protein [Deltaproteobacteria bacterium]
MKRILIAIMTLVFVAGFTPLVFAADVAKIGVVDFERVLKESSAVKLTQKELRKKGEGFQGKLKKEKASLDAISKAFEREALVLSPEKKREKEREFRIRVNDFKKMQEDYTKELRRIEIELINQMQKDVFKIANDMGKQDGFLLIIERKTAGVIYMPSKVDITDMLIKKYNENAAKKE